MSVIEAQPLYLSGPTASGKSAVAVELARLLDGEVVNADAYQVYDAFPTLTARPTEKEQGGVPHHLFGTLPATEPCDAYRLAELAKAVIAEIQGRGRKPIVVGGSGLYLKALTHGLGAPPADPGLRAELALLTPEERATRLQEVDPVGAARTDLQNDRYVCRNLEICLLTGLPLAEAKASWTVDPAPFEGIFLDWEREALYARINARTELMFAQGVVEEVAAVDVGAFSETARKMIGLREILEVLAGRMSEPDAIAAIQQATRRYAKRQLTWFRKEEGFRRIAMAEGDSAAEVAGRILEGGGVDS